MNLSYQILLNFFDSLDGEALDCGSDKEDSNIQQEGIKSKWILIDLQINICYINIIKIGQESNRKEKQMFQIFVIDDIYCCLD